MFRSQNLTRGIKVSYRHRLHTNLLKWILLFAQFSTMMMVSISILDCHQTEVETWTILNMVTIRFNLLQITNSIASIFPLAVRWTITNTEIYMLTQRSTTQMQVFFLRFRALKTLFQLPRLERNLTIIDSSWVKWLSKNSNCSTEISHQTWRKCWTQTLIIKITSTKI